MMNSPAGTKIICGQSLQSLKLFDAADGPPTDGPYFTSAAPATAVTANAKTIVVIPTFMILFFPGFRPCKPIEEALAIV